MLPRTSRVLFTALALVTLLGTSHEGFAKGKKTKRISLTSTGEELPYPLHWGVRQWTSISKNGRFVTFGSDASELLTGMDSGLQIFLRDRKKGKTSQVSVDSDGIPMAPTGQSCSISGNGERIAFIALVDGVMQVFVRNRKNNKTYHVSSHSDGTPGNLDSNMVNISSNGRFVAFRSFANNLVDDDTNEIGDIFVHDSKTGITERVSVGLAGEELEKPSFSPSLSADGRFVVFDAYGAYIRDRKKGTTEIVSVSSDGTLANHYASTVVISGNGRFVTFTSYASNLDPAINTYSHENIYVHDRKKKKTECVSFTENMTPTSGWSGRSSISDNGRYVTYESLATNIVKGLNGKAQIFSFDRKTNKTRLVSRSNQGEVGDAESADVIISGNGKLIVFNSAATNLVPNDTNNKDDAFVRDR